jgi:hypothetical protein
MCLLLLPNSEYSSEGLQFNRVVPPGIDKNYSISTGQIQSYTSAFERGDLVLQSAKKMPRLCTPGVVRLPTMTLILASVLKPSMAWALDFGFMPPKK